MNLVTKDKLNEIYEKIAASIDISEALFDKAEIEYKALGNWIDNETPKYKVTIYPQGSFALGTVVKPSTEADEYDLDLVCEFEEQYGLSAKQMKCDVVKPLLDQYNRIKEIEEKRRCWQVEYEHFKNFHMDVIPAHILANHIMITDKDEDNNTYDFIGSNPKGYAEWFHSRKILRYKKLREQYLLEESKRQNYQAEVIEIREYKIKTPLQKAIQILKRHRDVMFVDDPDNLAPVSIIITTLTAQIYDNEDNIADTLRNFLNTAETYVMERKQGEKYVIENPSYRSENFADKWNENPQKADAFFAWVASAKSCFLSLEGFDFVEVLSILGISLGDKLLSNVFSDSQSTLQLFENVKVDTPTALMPVKEKNILNAPHRQKPIWITPKGNRVIIKAQVKEPNGREYEYKRDGAPIKKDSTITFQAFFSRGSLPYHLEWQVVNLGYEARNDLRGGFQSAYPQSHKDKHIWTEHTQYSGSHAIQCFVISNRQCLAQSGVFIVNIE